MKVRIVHNKMSIHTHIVAFLFVPRMSNICNEKVQWNLAIKRSDITKPSYNKVIYLVPALYISLFFTPI